LRTGEEFEFPLSTFIMGSTQLLPFVAPGITLSAFVFKCEVLYMITNFYKVLCHIRVHICIGWAERAQIPKYIFEFNSRNEHLK